MATAEPLPGSLPQGEASHELAKSWRTLTRAATIVALLSSPALYLWLSEQYGWDWWVALLATLATVVAFRGLVDLLFHRLLPWPSLFGLESETLREEDVVARRRVWFWRFWLRIGIFVALVSVVLSVFDVPSGTLVSILPLLIIFPFYMLFNFAIMFGPLLIMNLSQIQAFEPGDAQWGVKLGDVRGQVEAKEEVRRVVSIWQSGDQFERAGGKRERGLLFLGAPGTGKTMLAKALATGFNSPFISIPGSGFAATFIGIDAIVVRILARRAKKLARKWGGQCIVFIDEIDAVGMRRNALGGGGGGFPGLGGYTGDYDPAEHLFFGPYGALNPSGDMILETRAWRERLFAARAPQRVDTSNTGRLHGIRNFMFPGGMGMGGGLALNQLLVVMDGIDNPPFFKKFFTNKLNTLLDGVYIVPRRIGTRSLRLPAARPRKEQIYFIGATNVPIEVLDPALTRPGRMGRHVWFRTPTKQDRLDILDLYINKVAHDAELDTGQRREEIARVTNGYAQPLDSPVLTPEGWVRMGDLEVGASVIGSDGSPTEVVAVHERGTMDVFRVAFNDGTSAECTADHVWRVENADPRMPPRTFRLTELVDRELAWSPRGSKFYLPTLGAVQFAQSEDLALDPYLLGLLLGDGGFSHTSPDFCTADAELLDTVAELVPAGVAPTPHGPRNWWLTGGSRLGVPRSQANPLTAALRELGLWKVTSRSKFVPTPYKLASAEDRLAVLQGLMDTDGSVDYRRGNGPTFYSHSSRLAADVAFLVRSLGGNARLRPKRDGWRVALDLPDGLVPFRLRRKTEGYQSSRKPFRKRIVAVEPVGPTAVRCITVAAEDGLYVTEGFTVTHNSPAMIEQVTSMALTIAHHSGREWFSWEDLVEAMTTLEAGTAVGVEYIAKETRAVAVHEAGHAAAGHVYLEGSESTRLSIRMRGGSLGHHQALEKEERFGRFQTEMFARLVWALGAMAAERVFYGENSVGVGGDVASATAQAGAMVGAAAMGPQPFHVDPREGESDEQARKRILDRFERIGLQIMNRTGGGSMFGADPIAGAFGDPAKRTLVAQILGQAYVAAHHLVVGNRDAIEHIADTLVEKRELFGDELLALLDESKITIPKIDLNDEASWPPISFSALVGPRTGPPDQQIPHNGDPAE